MDMFENFIYLIKRYIYIQRKRITLCRNDVTASIAAPSLHSFYASLIFMIYVCKIIQKIKF